MRRSSVPPFLTLAACVLSLPAAAQSAVPLCPGLTIVTAVSQTNGDYESIKTIESIAAGVVRLRYSSERIVFDPLAEPMERLERLDLERGIRLEDLRSATRYLQHFSDSLPALVPGTTSIGISAAVLHALKTKGKAALAIFNPIIGKPSLDRGQHPNVYDFELVDTLRRVGVGPLTVRVLVNDMPAVLPAVQATGSFYGDSSEFVFLDDAENPITLGFRIGIGAGALPPASLEAVAAGTAPTGGAGDKDVLHVVKITHRCPGAAVRSDAGALSGSALEQSLLEERKAAVYDIYFSFNSDSIRRESEPRLREIADILERHPDWRLSVEGHTDDVASDSYNQRLSERRAAAVKAALTQRYRIPARQLTTSGYGESRPQDTNGTLRGRARNRRVELLRQ